MESNEPREQTLSEGIDSLQFAVQQMIESMERSEKTRLLAIVNTHLETAKLYAREAGE